MPNDELFHHGIDGQKWGVRHGPPYPLDREDHNEIVERSHDATKKRHLSYERSGKYAKRMTDKDLNDTIDRLQREETYRRLVSKEREEKRAAKLAKQAKKEADERYKNQNELAKKQQELQEQQQKANKKANSIARKVIENLLTKAASTAGTQAGKYLFDKYIKKPDNENTDNTDNTNTDNKPKIQDVSMKKDTEKEKQLEALKKRQKELEDEKVKQTPIKPFGQYLRENKDKHKPSGIIEDEKVKQTPIKPFGQYLFENKGGSTEEFVNEYLLRWG